MVAIVALVPLDSNAPEDTSVVDSVRVPIVNTIGTGIPFKTVAMVVYLLLVLVVNVVPMELTLRERSVSRVLLGTTVATVNIYAPRILTALEAQLLVLLVLQGRQRLEQAQPLLRNALLEGVDLLQPTPSTKREMSGAMVTLVIVALVPLFLL